MVRRYSPLGALAQQLGTVVEVRGWIRSVRPASSSCLFMTLSDCTDTLQLVVAREHCPAGFDDLGRLSVDSVVAARGLLRPRPAGSARPGAGHGDIEVQVTSLDVLNRAKPLPLVLNEHLLPDEEKRLEHRHLDLRRPIMQRNIRFRAAVVHGLRQTLHRLGFVDIETPLLFKSTSEGAAEFVVPRGDGTCYALPQSPQQCKQLLTIAGFDKYYQVARCFRNEALRADRQPEFTQLDLEMGFAGEQDVVQVVETLLRDAWGAHLGLTPAFRTTTYDEALCRYGTDKPAALDEWHIATDCGDRSSITESLTLPATLGEHAQLCLVFSQSDIEGTMERRVVRAGGATTFTATRSRTAHVGCTLLGKTRLAFLSARDRQPNLTDWLWVRQFPLFRGHAGRLESMHHPFTAPLPAHADLLSRDPLTVRAQHYDLVLDGVEVGGGSVRIHDAALQEEVLRQHLGLPPDKVAQFKHLLDALGHGAPPHAGIALGVDRLIATMLGTASIRDVIAFPKNSSGADLLFKTPSLSSLSSFT